jgi:hypothetical protein
MADALDLLRVVVWSPEGPEPVGFMTSNFMFSSGPSDKCPLPPPDRPSGVCRQEERLS